MKKLVLSTALILLTPMAAHADFCATVKSIADAVENEDASFLPDDMTLNGASCEYDEGYEDGSVYDASCLWYDDAKTAASSIRLTDVSKTLQTCSALTFKGRTDDGKTIKYNYEYGDWVLVTLLKSGPGGVALRFQPSVF